MGPTKNKVWDTFRLIYLIYKTKDFGNPQISCNYNFQLLIKSISVDFHQCFFIGTPGSQGKLHASCLNLTIA